MQLNTWEALYFGVDEPSVLALVDQAHRWALNVSCSMTVGSSGAPMIVVRSVTGSSIRKNFQTD